MLIHHHLWRVTRSTIHTLVGNFLGSIGIRTHAISVGGLGTSEFETYMETIMTESIFRERFSAPEPETELVTYENYQGALSEVSVTALSMNSSMTDYVTPGYHKRIRDGEVINNPCDYVVETRENSKDKTFYHYYPTGYPDQWWKLKSGNLTARFLTGPYTPALFDRNMAPAPTFDVDSQAKSFALANVDSTPYEFGEDIGELRETINFLKNPVKSISDLTKVYKRRKNAIKRNPKFKERPDLEAKALADLWNTYSFAAAPLLRSILNACEAYDNRHDLKRPKRRSAHGFSKNKERLDVEHPMAPGIDYYVTFKKLQVKRVEAHAAIFYEVSNPLTDWQFALGLRLKDIPRTMWQLFPLSFMVDRLYNLSNAIAGAANLVLSSYTVSILAASLTHRDQEEHTMSLIEIGSALNTTVFTLNTPDHVKWTKFTYKREIWSPELWDVFPPFTGKGLTNSITKTIDLIALTISRLL